MNLMRFWPLIAGAIAVILTWAAAAFQINAIFANDKARLAQIRALEQWKIEQLLKNREIEIQHIDLKDYLKLLDSKYSRQCK